MTHSGVYSSSSSASSADAHVVPKQKTQIFVDHKNLTHVLKSLLRTIDLYDNQDPKMINFVDGKREAMGEFTVLSPPGITQKLLTYAACQNDRIFIYKLLNFPSVIEAEIQGDLLSVKEAIIRGHFSCVKVMLEVPEIRKYFRERPYSVVENAIMGNHENYVEILIKRLKLQFGNDDLKRLLKRAMKRNLPSLSKTLCLMNDWERASDYNDVLKYALEMGMTQVAVILVQEAQSLDLELDPELARLALKKSQIEALKYMVNQITVQELMLEDNGKLLVEAWIRGISKDFRETLVESFDVYGISLKKILDIKQNHEQLVQFLTDPYPFLIKNGFSKDEAYSAYLLSDKKGHFYEAPLLKTPPKTPPRRSLGSLPHNTPPRKVSPEKSDSAKSNASAKASLKVVVPAFYLSIENSLSPTMYNQLNSLELKEERLKTPPRITRTRVFFP